VSTRWAILTGEYPPQSGGVSDYSRLLAQELAAAGDEVLVYAPPEARPTPRDRGVSVERLADHFGPRGLVQLDSHLHRSRPDRILIQYVPHAFGWKAMNVPFAAWVAGRAERHAPVWVMFHEVAFPLLWRPPQHALLCAVTRLMARLLAGAAERIFSSIVGWAPVLRRLCPMSTPAEWLPVPSNIPSHPGIPAVRSAPGTVIGYFGTFGPATTQLLEPALVSLLRRPDRTALLLGRGGIAYREGLAGRRPELAGRLVALGELPPEEIAMRLRGCDVLLQPFSDGISTRRTSAMAGLANGAPLASNLGALSEPMWSTLECVSLAKTPDAAELSAAVERVLSLSPEERAALGRRSAELYRSRFGIENTIRSLREEPAGERIFRPSHRLR
jgi:glycosyltransferase involved in cell wall biosynthesis